MFDTRSIRITHKAILAAYRIGSFLYPEAKTYRLLADILNDSAIILDTLSPLLSSESLSLPFVSVRVPGVRVVALCTSASLRALCGIAAGGSKAALTLHFATPHSINGHNNGKGDVGDLNAKDASKETVLSLLGMLVSFVSYYIVFLPLILYTKAWNCCRSISDNIMVNIYRTIFPRRCSFIRKLRRRTWGRAPLLQ